MDNFKRLPYTEMPMEICKTLRVGDLVFMSGIEAVDYRQDGAIPDAMEDQIAVVVFKMHDTLVKSGLSLGNMVKHTLYMKKDTVDPKKVIEWFHRECYKYAPKLAAYPSTGTLVVVEGLVLEAFKIEVDAIAAVPGH